MMLLAAGAALTAVDLLSSLKDVVSSGGKPAGAPAATGFGVPDAAATSGPAAPFATAAPGANPVSPDTMRAMLALQARGNATGALSSQLFSRLDRDGNGRIGKSEFDDVVAGLGGQSADRRALFDALDGDGDGSVSGSEFGVALQGPGLPMTDKVRANAGTRELFQRLLQQQTDMLANAAPGLGIARTV
jgi:hypothetical protein